MATAGTPRAEKQQSPPARAWRAWRALDARQRMVALATLCLLVTMFLPWFSETGIANGKTPVALTLTAFDAFSLVEAVVLLICIGTFALLFVRGEGRGASLPVGDGVIILAAGSLAAILVFYRIFAGPSAGPHTSTGVQYGIFLALIAAVWLASTGRSMRAAGIDTPAPPTPPLQRPSGAAPLGREDARRVTFETPGRRSED
ncbi:MAG: hypothetical protein ACRDLP_07545 [Solirubrobacteraceae bacterium]